MQTRRNGISLAQALRDFGLVPGQIHPGKQYQISLVIWVTLNKVRYLFQGFLALGIVAINSLKQEEAETLALKGIAGHAGTGHQYHYVRYVGRGRVK